MKTLKFAGRIGKILKTSPHGNYVVLQLSKRIVIVGTYSNQWGWKPEAETESGFLSFVTYIGAKRHEQSTLREQITFYGGDIQSFRQAKRVSSYPMEFKVHELTVDSVIQLIDELQ